MRTHGGQNIFPIEEVFKTFKKLREQNLYKLINEIQIAAKKVVIHFKKCKYLLDMFQAYYENDNYQTLLMSIGHDTTATQRRVIEQNTREASSFLLKSLDEFTAEWTILTHEIQDMIMLIRYQHHFAHAVYVRRNEKEERILAYELPLTTTPQGVKTVPYNVVENTRANQVQYQFNAMGKDLLQQMYKNEEEINSIFSDYHKAIETHFTSMSTMYDTLNRDPVYRSYFREKHVSNGDIAEVKEHDLQDHWQGATNGNEIAAHELQSIQNTPNSLSDVLKAVAAFNAVITSLESLEWKIGEHPRQTFYFWRRNNQYQINADHDELDFLRLLEDNDDIPWHDQGDFLYIQVKANDGNIIKLKAAQLAVLSTYAVIAQGLLQIDPDKYYQSLQQEFTKVEQTIRRTGEVRLRMSYDEAIEWGIKQLSLDKIFDN